MSVSSDEYTDVTEQVLLFAVSPPFGFSTGWICGFLLGIFLVGIDWRLVFLLFIFLGFILQLLWVFLVRNRYRKPLNDPEIWRLVDTARNKMNITTEASLWLHDSDGYVLASNANVAFTAILLSPSMIQLLKDRDDYGEIVLANELEQVQRIPTRFFFIQSALAFAFGSSLPSFTDALFELFHPLFLVLIILVFVFVVFGSLFVFSVFGFRRQDEDKRVKEVYGVKPDVAKKIVFGDSEGAHPVLEEIESEELPHQWYKEHGGSEETLEISAIAGIVAGMVTFSVYLLTSGPLPVPMVAFAVAPLLGVITALVVFILGFAATRILSSGHAVLRHQVLSQDSLCTTLQSLLNSLNGYEDHTVRMIPSATKKPHMVIYDPDYDTIADIALTIKSSVFEVLASARYLLPYVLSEMKHRILDKRFGRFVFSYIGLSLLAWIGYLIFNSLGPRGIDITLLLDNLLPSFIWIWVVNLIAVFSLATAFYQVKKKNIDSEIAEKHPQWKEALELLIDTDLVTGSTPLSFEKRLEYIQSH